jgi:hypothetical protein
MELQTTSLTGPDCTVMRAKQEGERENMGEEEEKKEQ